MIRGNYGAILRRTRILTACLASLVAPVLLQAAEAGKTDSLEEVVVTARKTAESLQTTPVAVTALGEAALTQQQILEVVDLQHAAPDVAIGGAGTGPTSIVYLAVRGESQNSPNSASDSAVGIYVDGVYYARPIVGNLGFLDVNNVELLRGPQGTLFGRNTTGGALQVTSNLPTNQLEGSVEGGFGNYGQVLGQFVINVPLTDELAVRVAARYDEHSNYFTDPISGINPAAVRHDDTGRIMLRWAPSALPLTLVVAADRTDERDTGVATALVGYNANNQAFSPYIPALTGYNPANYLLNNGNYFQSFGKPDSPIPSQNTPFDSNKAQGISANLDADLGAVHLKSITAYRDSITANVVDLDGTPVNFGSFLSQYVQHQVSEELQLSGKIGRWDLIGGLFFFNESGTELSDSYLFGVLNDLGIPVGVGENLAYFNAQSKAAFVQTNYHISDTVRATLGYRYTDDTRKLDNMGRENITGANLCGVGTDVGNPVGQPCSAPYSAKYTYPAYVIGMDWQATDHLFLYIKTSRASMAGGFNTRPIPGTFSPNFAPETNKDIEVGAKADWLDNRLRTNLALFYSKQSDVQNIINAAVLSTTGGAPGITQFVTNAGGERKYGVELEITAIPWTGMEAGLTGAYLHAAYVAGTFYETQIVNGVPTLVDRSGEPVPEAPEWTASAGATQSFPLPIGKLSFHGDFAYRASVVYTWDTPAPGAPYVAAWNTANQLGVIPAYGLFNARIALNIAKPDLEVALWGRNLADKHYFTQQFDSYTGLGTAVDFQGDPRTYGVTVKYRF
jgi:iron complex outermembrane recepter protein